MALTDDQILVLRACVHPRPQSNRELTRATRIPLTDIPGILDALEAEGLIERYGDPIPGVRATQEGIDFLAVLDGDA